MPETQRCRGWISGELVAALLIFAILIVAAAPLRQSAREAAKRARCESARALIATVVATRLAEGKRGVGSALPDPPRCPSGGAFLIRTADKPIRDSRGRIIPAGSEYISCSIEDHPPVAIVPAR